MTLHLQFLLEQLENKEIIRRAASPEPEYSFKHTLTQETAYQSLVKPQRRQLHRAVAQAYEELYPERLDEFAAVLAEHYAEAGDDAKTILFAVRAGDVAARVYANAEAIAHYSKALEIASRMPYGSTADGRASAGASLLRDLYLKRGRAFELSGRYEQALDNYEEMKALAHNRGDERLELEALLACATIHAIPGTASNSPLARELTGQALALAQKLGLSALESKIYWNLMLLENWGGGDPRRAVEFGEKSLELARELNLTEQLAFTLHDLAMAYMLAKQRDRAEASQKEAAELWRELHNLPMYAETLNRTLLLHVYAGNLDRAVACGIEAYQLTQSIGNVVGEALAATGLCHVFAGLGQLDKAFEYGAEGTKHSRAAGVPSMWLGIQNQKAWIYGCVGMVEKGIETAQDGLDHSTRTVYGGDDYRREMSHASFRATLIRLELQRGNLAKAQEIFGQAPLVMRDDNTLFISTFDGNPVFLAAAELHLAEGDYVAAGATLDQLFASLKDVPVRPFLPAAYFMKGRILLAQGRQDEAVEAWQSARAEAEATNARLTLWRILFALAELQAQQGQHEDGAELLDQARTIVQFIANHSPADLRASFLALPQVREITGGSSLRAEMNHA